MLLHCLRIVNILSDFRKNPSLSTSKNDLIKDTFILVWDLAVLNEWDYSPRSITFPSMCRFAISFLILRFFGDSKIISMS